MNSDAALFLDKAARLLAGATAMFKAGFIEAAGRDAYLTGYHAAQAVIITTNGKPAKTHDGVKSEFSRLTKDNPGVPHDIRAFLFSASRLKEIADYELGPCELPAERVEAALLQATRFINCVTTLLQTRH